MLQKPRVRPCFRVDYVAPDGVFMLSESKREILSGRIYSNLTPLLNGQHTTGEIMSKLSGKVSPPEVMYALGYLQRRGVIDDASAPTEMDGYWHSLGVTTRTAHAKLVNQSVQVVGLGSADPAPLTTALHSMNVRLDADNPALTVYVTDDYLRPSLRQVNELALQSGKPWLLAKLIGQTLWVGPFFKPGETACWECLADRVHGNRQVEAFVQRKIGRDDPLYTSIAALPTTRDTAAALAANVIVRWIVTGSTQNQLVTLNTATLATEHHAVVRRPQCSACGDDAFLAERRAFPKPLALQPCEKRHVSDGGHRHLFPEETWAKYKHHISPISGVISSLMQKGEDNGLVYSYTAGHNFAMPRQEMRYLRKNLRSQSGGKGRTRTQAKVSGICEAIERFSGVYREGRCYERSATYAELGSEAIHVDELLCFSEEQYANRATINKALDSAFNIVPNRFDEALEISWTPVWSLANSNFRYIPTTYGFYGHPDIKHFFCGSNSSGCAAGNTLEEAIFQGLLELVERDAVAIWWYNQVQRPSVDLTSFNNPYFAQMTTHYDSLGRSLWVLDLTADLPIPTFAAVSACRNREVEDIIVGFGSHLDAGLAIQRAITEVNQFLPAVVEREPDGSTRYYINDNDAFHWFQTAKLENQTYLTPNGEVRGSADYANPFSNDIRDDVQHCVDALAEAGLNTLVLDQTLPDVGLSVCRVIVPGLRHMWRRIGPGRLYDVPVAMGWLDEPIAQEQLNTYSLFF